MQFYNQPAAEPGFGGASPCSPHGPRPPLCGPAQASPLGVLRTLTFTSPLSPCIGIYKHSGRHTKERVKKCCLPQGDFILTIKATTVTSAEPSYLPHYCSGSFGRAVLSPPDPPQGSGPASSPHKYNQVLIQGVGGEGRCKTLSLPSGHTRNAGMWTAGKGRVCTSSLPHTDWCPPGPPRQPSLSAPWM